MVSLCWWSTGRIANGRHDERSATGGGWSVVSIWMHLCVGLPGCLGGDRRAGKGRVAMRGDLRRICPGRGLIAY